MIRPITLSCIVSILFTLNNVSIAIADELDDAKSLMANEKPSEAYDLLIRDINKYQQNEDYLYTLAVAAIDSNRFKESIPILKQVILLSPNHYGARLDLGRALAHIGQYDEARQYLDSLINLNPPAGAKQIISQYIGALDAREKELAPKVSFYIETGFGYDNNINSGTGLSQIRLPVFGNALLTLNQDSRKTSSNYGFINSGLSITKQINNNVAIVGYANVLSRNNINYSEFNNISPSLGGNVIYAFDNQFVRTGFSVNQYFLNGKRNREILGINADWNYILSSKNRVGIFGQYSKYSFFDVLPVSTPTLPNENFKQTLVGTSWAHKFNDDLQINTAFIYGNETAPNRIDGDKQTASLRFNTEYSFNPYVFSSLGGGYQYSDFEKNNVIFLKTRKDDQYDINTSIGYRFNRHLSAVLRYSALKINSNIPINEIKREDVSLSIRYDL